MSSNYKTLRNRKINILKEQDKPENSKSDTNNKIVSSVCNPITTLLPYYDIKFPVIIDKHLFNNNSKKLIEPCNSNMTFDFNRAIKLIPEFDGTSDKLPRFLQCCKLVYKDTKTDEDRALFLELVQVKLVDSAYNQTVLTCSYKNWQELQKDLNQKFSNVRALENIQVDLVQARQRFDENVKDFGIRIENLLADLNRSCASSTSDEGILDQNIKTINSRTALRAFEDGLRDPLRILIKASRFTNLKDAITKGIEEERLILFNKSKHPNSQNSSIVQTPVKCQICFKTGHTASKCFSRNNNQQSIPFLNNSSNFNTSSNNNRQFSTRYFSRPQNQTSPNPRINQISYSCAYCKKFGHHISVCRSREKSNQRQQSEYIHSSTSQPQSSENLPELHQESKDVVVKVQNI